MRFTKPHLHLNIANVDVSVSFYERLLGVAPVRRRPDGATFDVLDPPLFLVVQQEPRTGVNAGHFGLMVATEELLDAAYDSLLARGLRPDRKGAKLWIEDPDGNGWELLVTPT